MKKHIIWWERLNETHKNHLCYLYFGHRNIGSISERQTREMWDNEENNDFDDINFAFQNLYS